MGDEQKPGPPPVYVGTSGWVLPPAGGRAFPDAEGRLERYSSRLNAAEIHTSFQRAHPATVYAEWAASVPDNFRFSVKMHRAITHDSRLAGPVRWIDEFVRETSGLGDKLGCFLMELPPNLVFNMQVARRFTTALRERFSGAVAVEPRHKSWFKPQADVLLAEARIARVLADPVVHEPSDIAGGFQALTYCRLHGWPTLYCSAYGDDRIRALAERIATARQAGTQVWCIFNNTVRGNATGDAVSLASRLALKPAVA